MHDVLIVDPLSHFLQQPVMPDIVKVGSQIKVEDPRLPLSYASATRLIASCAVRLGRYPYDPGWKSASNTGSRMSLSAPCTTLSRIAGIDKTRTLPPSFGISCFRAGSGLLSAPGQFVAQLLEQSLHALRLDGLERDPVYSRGPIVLFGHRIRCAQGLHLTDVDV